MDVGIEANVAAPTDGYYILGVEEISKGFDSDGYPYFEYELLYINGERGRLYLTGEDELIKNDIQLGDELAFYKLWWGNLWHGSFQCLTIKVIRDGVFVGEFFGWYKHLF